MHRILKVEKIVGLILVLLALVTLIEANRLRATPGLRYELGPATFPFFVGAALFLLGIYFVITGGDDRRIHKGLPRGRAIKTQVGMMGIMIGCGVALPILGYFFSTLVTAVLLFRVVGRYRWAMCVFIGLIVAGLLFLIFRFAVFVPFPTGLIWDF